MSNTAVAVHFSSCRQTYHYSCKYPVKKGDHVIVDSPYNGYTCVKVIEVLPHGSMKVTKPVVQVVDDSDYLGDRKRQQRMVEIKTELKARSAKIAEMTFFKQLAAMDNEAADLVAELERLAA